MLKNWSSNRYLILAVIVIMGYLTALFFMQDAYFANDTFPNGISLIRDDYDRLVHFDRAQWYLQHKIPYKEVFSEYPQLVTYLFAVPALFTSNNYVYINLYSAFMVLAYIALVLVTLRLLEVYQKPKGYVLLLLLPSFIYHTLNRFDILPALLVSLSLLLFLKNKYWLSISALLVGFFIKWYPILALPVLFSQLWIKDKRMFYKYGLYTALVLSAVFGLSYLWSGPAIFEPYKWNALKGFYYESIYYLIDFVQDRIGLKGFISTNFLAMVFQPLTLLLPFSAFINIKILSKEQILNTILFIILVFIFFCTGRAPQFNLWFIPLYILAIRNRRGVALLIAFDLVNFLFYPVGSATLHTNYSFINDLLSAAKNLLFLALLYYLLIGSFKKRQQL